MLFLKSGTAESISNSKFECSKRWLLQPFLWCANICCLGCAIPEDGLGIGSDGEKNLA